MSFGMYYVKTRKIGITNEPDIILKKSKKKI